MHAYEIVGKRECSSAGVESAAGAFKAAEPGRIDELHVMPHENCSVPSNRDQVCDILSCSDNHKSSSQAILVHAWTPKSNYFVDPHAYTHLLICHSRQQSFKYSVVLAMPWR